MYYEFHLVMWLMTFSFGSHYLWIGNCQIEPYVVVNHLGEIQYINFLERTLPLLLENVPLNVHVDMWFQHKSTPPHFLLHVCNWLKNLFLEMWISHGDPVIWWPPCSSDLNQLYILSWGCIKELQDHDILIIHILVAATDIRDQPRQLVPIKDSIWCYHEACEITLSSSYEEIHITACEFSLLILTIYLWATHWATTF
jgi:hypothetical protein